MSKRRRNPARGGARGALTDEQRLGLIPGGPVNPHRAARSEIVIETRAMTERGAEITTGQRISSPVHRLYLQGVITLEEASAAQLFQIDHDSAHAGCKSPLAAVLVDSRGDGTGGIDSRLDHAGRFRDARAHLCPELARIADAAILILPESGIDPTLTGIGASVLPDASRQAQREVGRGFLVVICRALAQFYGRRKRQYSRRGDAR